MMARGIVRVRDLAQLTEMDPEEALLLLWTGGFDHLDSIDAVVPQQQVAAARMVLRVPHPRELKSRHYWEDLLGLSSEEFTDYAEKLGITLRPRARTLPKGAIARLKRDMNLNPHTQVRRAKVAIDKRDSYAAEEPPELPPLEWEAIGRVRDVVCLEADEVRAIHDRLVVDAAKTDDAIDPPGVRSDDLLESAVNRPKTSLGVRDKYPTAEMAAAALVHSLVLNHPFHNGNKRAALVAMLAMLDRNNLVPTCSDSDLFKFIVRVAQHGFLPRTADNLADREVLEMAEWIRCRTRVIQRDERPLKWRELKRILRTRFDVEFSMPATGNRILLTRHVSRRGWLRKARAHVLRCHTHYSTDGGEVPKNQLHQIRRELELDEEHHVDSEVFYGGAEEVDDFIGRYRRILRELAKL